MDDNVLLRLGDVIKKSPSLALALTLLSLPLHSLVTGELLAGDDRRDMFPYLT